MKKECGYLTVNPEEPIPEECKRVIEQYHLIGTISIPIPESQFNRLKQDHKLKVEISKHLDNHPGTSIRLFRIKMWFRDNFWRAK
jgi:hypothetical protein